MNAENSHILLVEDDPNDIELTERAFRKVNLLNELKVVTDGQEALDYLFCQGDYSQRNPTDLPNVVLLDLNMPKVSGFEVLKQIRQNEITRFLPVVVMTSSSHDLDRLKSYREGCNSYVQKPVNFDDFVSAVNQLGMYWLLLNKNPNR
jgi:CheY-like chemotaxis protein